MKFITKILILFAVVVVFAATILLLGEYQEPSLTRDLCIGFLYIYTVMGLIILFSKLWTRINFKPNKNDKTIQ